jgi:hypothetical protein
VLDQQRHESPDGAVNELRQAIVDNLADLGLAQIGKLTRQPLRKPIKCERFLLRSHRQTLLQVSMAVNETMC